MRKNDFLSPSLTLALSSPLLPTLLSAMVLIVIKICISSQESVNVRDKDAEI